MIRVALDLGMLRMFRALSGMQWTLRSLLVAAVVVCLVATQQTSANGIGWFWVLVVALAGAWTFFSPDSGGAAVLIVALGISWSTQVDEPVSGWLLVFALGVLVIHTATALASAGPPTAPVGAETLKRWSQAAGLVALATVAVWSLFLLLGDVPMQASTVRLVAALVAVSLLAWSIRVLSLGDSTHAGELSRREFRE